MERWKDPAALGEARLLYTALNTVTIPYYQTRSKWLAGLRITVDR